MLTGILSLFGVGGSSDSRGKGVVEQIADVADNYKPGAVTQHNMDMEQIKAEDASQDSARKYVPGASASVGNVWLDAFNTVVDGLNRLPRPILALWAIGVLIGWVPSPEHLNGMHPLALNILWTVVAFFFGVRTISQDLPKLIAGLRKK